MRLWKWIGVAGITGVAATGVVLARDERERRAYTPDDVRARLHERAGQLAAEPPPVAERRRFPRLGEKRRGLLTRLRD